MKKYLFPPLILIVAGGLTWWLIVLKEEPKIEEPDNKDRLVDFLVAKRTTQRIFVDALGTVRPRTSATLVAEAPGLIKAVAPFPNVDDNRTGPPASFRPGGFFEKGDLLVSIEDIDHRATKADAEALLRTAEFQMEQERALAEQARAEWELDRDWANAPDLVKRLPQIRKAEAETVAAEARLAQAVHNLDRARVRAPFRGRIMETMADVGQRVGGGTSPVLARVYALDVAEIDLSISRSELIMLAFDEGSNDSGYRPEVHVLDKSDKVTHRGELDRSEGIVDPRSRYPRVVAKVEGAFADPFAPTEPGAPAALYLGEFVKARLFGPSTEVFVIPSLALREEQYVLIIDEENRIIRRKVSTLKETREEIWVMGGLDEGERVCLTPLEVVAKGMKVRTAPQEEGNRTSP